MFATYFVAIICRLVLLLKLRGWLLLDLHFSPCFIDFKKFSISMASLFRMICMPSY